MEAAAPVSAGAGENVHELLDRLAVLLEDFDAESLAVLEKLRRDVRLASCANELDQLARAVENYDFEQALLELTVLRQHMPYLDEDNTP